MKKQVKFLGAVLLTLQMVLSYVTLPAFAEDGGVINTPYTEPDTQAYNMNIDWKYKKPSTSVPLKSAMDSVAEGSGESAKQFYAVDYNDSDWETVSVPHQVNAHDSFKNLISFEGDTSQ